MKNSNFKIAAAALGLLALIFGSNVTLAATFQATNNLGGTITVGFFATNSSGQFTFGGLTNLASGTSNTITGSGTNYAGVAVVNQTLRVAQVSRFTALANTNGARGSYLVTNGFSTHYLLASSSSTPGSVSQGSGYSTNAPGTIPSGETNPAPVNAVGVTYRYVIVDTNGNVIFPTNFSGAGLTTAQLARLANALTNGQSGVILEVTSLSGSNFNMTTPVFNPPTNGTAYNQTWGVFNYWTNNANYPEVSSLPVLYAGGKWLSFFNGESGWYPSATNTLGFSPKYLENTYYQDGVAVLKIAHDMSGNGNDFIVAYNDFWVQRDLHVAGNTIEGSATVQAGANNSHGEGQSTVTSSGFFSHAENYSVVSGPYAHGEGVNTTASGTGSHVEGGGSVASGLYSHAAGYGANATNDNTYVWSDGTYSAGSTTSNQWTASAQNGFRFLGGPLSGNGSGLITMPTTTLLSTTNVSYTFRTNDGADTLVFTNSPNPCHLWLTLSGNYGHLILRYDNATNTILHITTPALASINYLGGTSNAVATNGARQWFDMAGTNWPNARCDTSLIQP